MKSRSFHIILLLAVEILLGLLAPVRSRAEGFGTKRENDQYYRDFGIKGVGRFSWSLEWGSTLSFYDSGSYIFMAEEGFAVEGGETIINPHVNAFALISLGYNASYNTRISLGTGWQGIQEGKRIIPLTARITYVFAGLPDPAFTPEEGSPYVPKTQHFVFFDTGAGLSQSQLHGVTLLAKAGYGMSFPLGYGMSIDTILSFQLSYAHPEIYDHFADRKVPWSMVGKSDSLYMGASLSMAVNF